MSLRSSAGSPKKRSPPCCSSVSSARWMVPTVCLLTLPYLVVSVPAFSAVHCSTACRSLKSSSSRPCSSATLKTMLSTPSCVSLSCSRRAISTGPISRHRRAHRMALLAEQVPVDRREGAALVAVDLELLGALDGAGIVAARLADARQVALHVGHEDRHAIGGEALGERLQGHRLAGAGRARDQAMAVAVLQQEILVGVARAHEDRCVVAHAVPSVAHSTFAKEGAA